MLLSHVHFSRNVAHVRLLHTRQLSTPSQPNLVQTNPNNKTTSPCSTPNSSLLISPSQHTTQEHASNPPIPRQTSAPRSHHRRRPGAGPATPKPLLTARAERQPHAGRHAGRADCIHRYHSDSLECPVHTLGAMAFQSNPTPRQAFHVTSN